jgi:hypothetical protein
MSRIFKLVQLQFAFGHGMVWMNAFQCLDTRFFVNTDNMDTRLMQRLRLMVEFAHLSDFLPKIRFIFHFMI